MEALRLHALTPDRFEEARTDLALGEFLRRARRRAEAREPLRRAVQPSTRSGPGRGRNGRDASSRPAARPRAGATR